MPRLVTPRTKKPARSGAQKCQTISASRAAKEKENSCSSRVTQRRSLRLNLKAYVQTPLITTPSTPSPSLDFNSGSNAKLVKSLGDKVYYSKKVLQKSRLENSAQQKEHQNTLQTALFQLSDAKNELSITQATLTTANSTCQDLQRQLLDARLSAVHATVASTASQTSFQRKSLELASISRTTAGLKDHNKALRYRLKATQRKLRLARASLSIATNREQRRHIRLKVGGVYTPNARAIARTLVRSGCSQKHVGKTIQEVGKLLHVEVIDNMSKRTVRRAVIEGGVAASIQVGHAIAHADSITFSDDATSHRHINYESRHIAMRSSNSGPPQIFFLGVDPATDHSSATQYEGWKETIAQLSAMYSESPIAKRTGTFLSEADVALKLKGTNGDHASDQKKKHSMLFDWKMDQTRQALGSKILAEMSQSQLLELMGAALQKKLEDIGGQIIWDSLSDSEHHLHNTNLVKEVALRLGKTLYNELSDHQKHEFELFFRGGCCMHKDLNAVKGGDKELCGIWKSLNVLGPVLLANKDNMAVLTDPSQKGSKASNHALEVSGRGGTKATTLAGMIFNHKDDKKGQQDTYQWYFFSVLGYAVRFPDTSNTRYGSHCDAAAELLTHLPLYIEFLEFVRDRKDKAIFTNIEDNLWKALHCSATLTELSVLAVYGQAISLPYMAIVRGPVATNLGILNLGPIHTHVTQHLTLLLDNPLLFIALDANSTQSSLDGNPWSHHEVFYAVKALLPNLPFFPQAFSAFLTGALSTWHRFAADYHLGGTIANATDIERSKVYMPPTNDYNEGALGAKRQDTRHRPNHSSISYNSIASLKRNDTETFITANLQSEEDTRYLRSVARKLDSSKLESRKKQAQTDYDRRVVAEKRQKQKDRTLKDTALQSTLDNVILTSDMSVLQKETRAQLELRLKKYRQLIFTKFKLSKTEFFIPVQSKLTRQADRVSYIVLCHAKYTSLTSANQTSHSLNHNPNSIDDDLESDHEMDSI